MTIVPLSVTALGPLAFPERKTGVQFRSSLPYVPGTAIYGALGMLLSQEWAGKSKEFAELFRSIRCHNAYPAVAGDPWSRPLPMTAMQPKGGKPKVSGAPSSLRRPYDDSLYDRVCWEQQRPTALVYAPADREGRPWESAGRVFYTLEDPEGKPWRPGADLATASIGRRQVAQRVLTRVSINRQRGIAEDSRLYSPLVINEVTEDRSKQLVPAHFCGSIGVPDGESPILAALADITHLGGRQSTGLGEVQIRALPTATAQEDLAALRKRVEAMSQRFKQQAELYHALGGSAWNTRTIVTVNLLSDALLFEQGWLPTNQLSASLLNELVGIDARLLRSFSTTSVVGGWNVLWQRPKPTAMATTMGSLFVFEIAGEIDDATCRALAQLEAQGIGERRAEGYGQVRICDEFHLLPDTYVPEEA